VFTVLAGLTLLLAGFIAAAIPALVEQGRRLVEAAPQYVAQLSDDSSAIGQLNQRFHLQETVQQIVDGGGPGLASGVISVGEAVFGAFSGLLVVAVLTVYFLADMPRVRTTLYRFMPAPRRPRAILLGDQIMVKVGGYVLGNVVISVISAVVTFVWLIAFGVPYPLLLAILFALLDLIPVIGSLIAGALVALAAFSVSVPVGLATIGYFVAYKLVEDYLLTPKVFGRVLRMPALVTVCAILIGGALLGLVGALVALPTAAAIMLLVQEVVFPRLDRAHASGEPAADPAA
jgi:predicted PurR-regulated permease PerM